MSSDKRTGLELAIDGSIQTLAQDENFREDITMAIKQSEDQKFEDDTKMAKLQSINESNSRAAVSVTGAVVDSPVAARGVESAVGARVVGSLAGDAAQARAGRALLRNTTPRVSQNRGDGPGTAVDRPGAAAVRSPVCSPGAAAVRSPVRSPEAAAVHSRRDAAAVAAERRHMEARLKHTSRGVSKNQRGNVP